MSAILLLDGVMIIISYTSPTKTSSLSVSIVVTIRNASVDLLHSQESGTYLLQKPSYSKFSVKIFKFSLPWQQGLV